MERKKPLVKEFFDRDAEIVNHLQTRLTHVPQAVAKINKLYTCKDGRTHKYRVNWYADVVHDFMTTKQIVASQYITVITNKEGRVVEFSVR